MKRLTHVLALFLMVAALPALASSDKAAKALYEKGKAAEARQDYIAAYNFYHQAWELKPSELPIAPPPNMCVSWPRHHMFIKVSFWSMPGSCRRR